MSKPRQSPYYLDFNQIDNSHKDKLERLFKTYTSVKDNQKNINQSMETRTFDYSQQYKSCLKKDQNVIVGGLTPSNGVPKNESVAKSPEANPYSSWGINNSSRESIASMSLPYLRMKQQQELNQLQQNTQNYAGLLDDIKKKHATELQYKLQITNNNQVDESRIDVNDKFAQIAKPNSNPKSLNAQGEYQDHNPNIYNNQPNKYQIYKQMSPEMLNPKPGNQQILPNYNDQDDGDVFDMTSFKYRTTLNEPNKQLKMQQLHSYNKILKTKSILKASNQ